MAKAETGARPRTPSKRRRLLIRWSGWSLLATAVLTIVVLVAARRSGEAVPAAGADVAGLTSVLTKHIDDELVPLRFEDVTAAVGVHFRHMPFPRKSLLPEDMGSGVACGDYDGDGWTDLYFVNFSENAVPGSTPAPEAHARLYRNVNGKTFEDTTTAAGVGFIGQGQGACWGDYDNDGDVDLYVTARGDNALFANQGDGTFQNVTESSAAQDTRFSTGCSWADFDRDGNLDLYVCNYVDFVYRAEHEQVSIPQYSTEQPYTLNPSSYGPQANTLFKNTGRNTFEDVSTAAGVADPLGRSLSATWVDLNNDGWVDLYVANDVSNNGVFLNQHDGTFADIGASSLAADYRGAMGIAVADLDNDLDHDLLITHWLAQENALYRNMITDAVMGPDASSRLWFMDEADDLGLGQISLDMVGWATAFADLDNDGWRDLWILNGSTLEQSDNHRLLEKQRSLLFWNRGKSGFVEVGERSSAYFAQPHVARGGAQLDFDQDGRLDIVTVTHGGPATVLRNTASASGHYLRLTLRQTGGNTQAIGARAYVTSGGRTQMAEVGSSSSYLSQDESTLHFGIGAAEVADTVKISWPDGHTEQLSDVAADQNLHLTHTPQYPGR